MYTWTRKLLMFPQKNRVSVFLVKSQIHVEAWEGGFSFHAEMLRCMLQGVMMEHGPTDRASVRVSSASATTNRTSLLVNKGQSGCCFVRFSKLSRNQEGLFANVGSLGSFRHFCC